MWALSSMGTIHDCAEGKNSGETVPSLFKIWPRRSATAPATIFEPNPPFNFGQRKARIAPPGEHVRRLELLVQAYHGRSPDGQFFEQTIDSIGLAIRLGF